MKALIVYDSFFGNTEKVAQTMGDALAGEGEIVIRRVGDVQADDMTGLDLLIAGSPTRGFSPTPAITNWVKELPPEMLEGVKVAAFDTRIALADAPWFLSPLIRMFGYAAGPISRKLREKGGEVVIRPAGFAVQDTEGPMKEGELERAADWARQAALK